MVRRRTRIKSGSVTNNGKIAFTYTIDMAAGGGGVLEDQNFASPKRKDAKIDNISMGSTTPASDVIPKLSAKLKPSDFSKRRVDRSVGRTIGVPLATRSQTKTIENFFKAKTAAKLKETKENKTSSDLYTLPKTEIHSPSAPEKKLATKNQLEADILQADFIFELSEDTNDTDNTDLSGEIATADFATHRAQLRDSCSSSSSTTTENIFLQEPVLTLNVDKTLNQASSIKINNTLASAEPVFSSPPSITAAALNGRFNQIASLVRLSPRYKHSSFDFEEKKTTEMLLLPENESSSSDSGVALGSGEQNYTPPEEDWLAVPPELLPHSRKPATPHRILCPSPIKVVSRVGAPDEIPQIVRNATSYNDKLSPRKSQHHPPESTAAPKTRRRLNPNVPEKLLSPQKTTNVEASSEDGVENHMQDFGTDSAIAFYETSNDDMPPTTYKNNKIDPSKHQITTAKTVQPKLRHQKPSLPNRPLAATNGNRELSEFFPVRRSVRKTKSAVKEEIMRNFEQAILEERADGLKVEHFEGKGRGVVAARRFERGEFVIEYEGDFISMSEADDREKRYAVEDAGCYMYYFKHRNQQYCIDATADTGKFGRLLNHSRNGNLITKVIEVKQRPHLILIAKDDIEVGDELTYDYGDRSKVSLLHHPWLAF